MQLPWVSVYGCTTVIAPADLTTEMQLAWTQLVLERALWATHWVPAGDQALVLAFPDKENKTGEPAQQ